MAVETSHMIRQSARASPGGSTALRTRWTRRSVLVNVPSFSAKHVAGQLGRLAHEDVLAHEEVELLQVRPHPRRVRLAADRVLPDAVEGLEHAFAGLLDEVGDRPALVGGERCAPEALELLQHRRIGDLLVAGEREGQRAHVAGSLHVVLAADRVDARGFLADLPAQHREVGQVLDVLGPARVLGDAQRVEDGRR